MKITINRKKDDKIVKAVVGEHDSGIFFKLKEDDGVVFVRLNMLGNLPPEALIHDPSVTFDELLKGSRRKAIYEGDSVTIEF